MTDSRHPEMPGDEGPDTMAAELALGVLEGEERASATRRVLSEPGFARAVDQWRGYLAQLFDLWPEIPAPDILPRIERSIDRVSGVPTVVSAQPRGSRIWPSLAVLSSVAAVGLLAILLLRPVPLPTVPQPRVSAPVAAPQPTLVASLEPDAKVGPMTVVYDQGSGTIRLTESTLARADRSAELWVIPADGTPRPLGLLQDRGGTALTLSPAVRRHLAVGATLAVSIEPLGGSKTGLPTGPVVAKGALAPV
ncbi:anti-sigma factor [Sphingomonas sp. TREG-RG-20F-R18-01]|uniref:anti-sigma factor n=1 Tax=Sphingomonas sp. TREG-RG-20F-R18-01 TaxID=2914982 RepID=UPI001F58BEFC|nr:anti-sigma factor [Sphingomonas sp. TREG-RG-20F-R18-01]